MAQNLPIGLMALGLLTGAGFGWLFFRLLAVNSRLYTAGRVGPATALHVGRLAGAVLLFVALARLGGAAPLLAAFVGFLAIRPLLIRRHGRGVS
ncbi:ATP synthase subunit I [Niveispirillum sp. BGYR6]|uniref:N-ATPase subunit AtpR n=1 Tax=Niveispirillum sp. BGYR6 TaxID=2971249 RepID=UPI0022B9B1D4|nr:ATP synthase subunit I [Niveispirillum sp. BGYR6]MDG5494276.1 ATP synthase subunit I [Niveispirillum sp. BGYR6]